MPSRNSRAVGGVEWLNHPEFRALAAAVRQAPEDDLPRLVAADWLDECGEPGASVYAEFVRECLRHPSRMSKKAERLLDDNLERWLRPMFLGGQPGRHEDAVRRGSTVRARLSFCLSNRSERSTATLRLKWVRGFVGEVAFGGAEDKAWVSPVTVFKHLARRAAAACPAASMVPDATTTDWWLRVQHRSAGPRGGGTVHDLVVPTSTAQLLPAFGPSYRVIPLALPDRKAAKAAIPEQMRAAMSEYAHSLVAAELPT